MEVLFLELETAANGARDAREGLAEESCLAVPSSCEVQLAGRVREVLRRACACSRPSSLRRRELLREGAAANTRACGALATGQ